MKNKRVVQIMLCILLISLVVCGCTNSDHVATVNGESIGRAEVEAIFIVNKFNHELKCLFEKNCENFSRQYQFAESAIDELLNKNCLTMIEKEYLRYLQNREMEWDNETALNELLRMKILLQEAENRNITVSKEQAMENILSMTDFSIYYEDENLIRYIYDEAAQNVGYQNFTDFLNDNENILINEVLITQFQQAIGSDIFNIANLTDLEDTSLNRQIAWNVFENNLPLNAEITVNEKV